MSQDWMGPIRTPRDRYRTDRQFRALVDTLMSYAMQCQFTPSELREAAVLASIRYSEITVRQYHIELTPELHHQLLEFEYLLDGAKTLR